MKYKPKIEFKTGPPDEEKLRDAIKRARQYLGTYRGESVDIVLMDRFNYHQLRLWGKQCLSFTASPESPGEFESILGIPIEVLSSQHEICRRRDELELEGKHVRVCAEEVLR
jgi:hypothetical protein